MRNTRRLRYRSTRCLSVLVVMAATGSMAQASDRSTIRLSPLASGAASITGLVSWPNPSHLGERVFFTASVGGQDPSGTVTFTEGETVFCGGPVALREDDTALCLITTLSSGTHEIVATYSGDQANAPAASDPLSQSVSTLLVTGMVFSSQCMFRPVDPGEPYTYSVRVFAFGGTSPQGDVVFSDGTNVLCTVPIVDGQATCTTTNLVATGDEPLTSLLLRAEYLGDGVHAPTDWGQYRAQVRNPLVFIFRDDFDYSDTCPTQW